MIFLSFAKTIRKFVRQSDYQSSKFRTKSWVEIKDDARGTYNTNSQIRFKT